MTFKQFVGSGTEGVIGLINVIIVPLLIGVVFLYFVWGVVNYFFINGGDDKKREEGKQFVLWGILGITLMFTVWGIVNIVLSTFGLTPAP